MKTFTDGLMMSWWMFFDTFWALVLGFTLSGAVQAFVSRKAMRKALGDHKPKTIVKASFFGVISSSCSYAASALAKSLFAKGADFTASMIFMFASTNLVLELGLVIWVLIGWQFALAEFIGGAIMITLLAILLPRLIPANLISGVQGKYEELESNSLTRKANWHDAAGYTIGDFTMLRTELVVGFLVSGLATAYVPDSFWRGLFLTGHGALSTVENVLIGPFIALISFVCSVGNVPLAATLWNSGISFGGTISFIYADLIALPLVLIYIKYYGKALALRLVAIFWLVMSLSGLITEYLFKAIGLEPSMTMSAMSQSHIGMNRTTILNLIAIATLTWVYYMYRTRNKAVMENEVQEFAKDFVCGMQVRISDAPASYELNGQRYYFCMEGCKDSFAADSKKFLPN
jgi:hypothetical protein